MSKVSYSKVEQTKLCLEWKSSKLTKKEFCKRYYINNTGTFSYWLKKRNIERNNSILNQTLDFLPIKEKSPDFHIASEANQTSIDSTMFDVIDNKVEIILPNKITLKITLDPSGTINFIKGLLSCNL